MEPLNKIINTACLECEEPVRVLIYSAIQTHQGPVPGVESWRTDVEVIGALCSHDQAALIERIASMIKAGVEPQDGPPILPNDKPGVAPDVAVEMAQADLVTLAGLPPDEGGLVITTTIYPRGEPIEVFEVYYKRLVSFGNYEHEEIGMRANVPIRRDGMGLPVGGGDPLDTLAKLRTLVNASVNARTHAEALSSDIQHLNSRRNMLASDIKAMGKQWQALKKFLTTIGVDPDQVRALFAESDLDDVPF